MVNELDLHSVHCPYCGELLEMLIDTSIGDQEYVEDCQVCCSPIEVTVQMDVQGKLANVSVRRDSD